MRAMPALVDIFWILAWGVVWHRTRGRSLVLTFVGLKPGRASAVGIVPLGLSEVMCLKG